MKPSIMRCLIYIYFSMRSEESRVVVFAESVIYVLLSRGFFTRGVIERVFFVSLPLAMYCV